jgi:hypothetical protein
MFYLSAGFSGWFRLRDKPRKIFNTTVSTKSHFFLNFDLEGATNGQPPLGEPLFLYIIKETVFVMTTLCVYPEVGIMTQSDSQMVS